jgi:hypothetical protein
VQPPATFKSLHLSRSALVWHDAERFDLGDTRTVTSPALSFLAQGWVTPYAVVSHKLHLSFRGARQREPGIHCTTRASGEMDSGLDASHRPGMTTACFAREVLKQRDRAG